MRRYGFTIVECLVACVILGATFTLAAQFFGDWSKAQTANVRRWKAQLALESVVDIIASSQESDIALMISNPKFPWVSTWEEAQTLSNIQVQFNVGGAPYVGALPGAFTSNDIDIIASGDFYPVPGSPKIEKLIWQKRLEHQ